MTPMMSTTHRSSATRFLALFAFLALGALGLSACESAPSRADRVRATAAATPREMLTAPREGTELAILSGGCFWGMEEILRKIPGVLETDVGYTGGDASATTSRPPSIGRATTSARSTARRSSRPPPSSAASPKR
jgi:peptide methionine sulfoxide reductase msrA/msrB